MVMGWDIRDAVVRYGDWIGFLMHSSFAGDA